MSGGKVRCYRCERIIFDEQGTPPGITEPYPTTADGSLKWFLSCRCGAGYIVRPRLEGGEMVAGPGELWHETSAPPRATALPPDLAREAERLRQVWTSPGVAAARDEGQALLDEHTDKRRARRADRRRDPRE